MEETTFRSMDVLRFIPSMTLRKLQWADERRFSFPAHKGHLRLYTAWDIAQLAVIQALTIKGVGLHGIRNSLKYFTPAALSKMFSLGQSVLLVYLPRKPEHKRIIKVKFCGPTNWHDLVLNAKQPCVVLDAQDVLDDLVYRGVPAACFKEKPKQRAA